MASTADTFSIFHGIALTCSNGEILKKINIEPLRNLFIQSHVGNVPVRIAFNLSDNLILPLRTDYIESIGDGGFVWHGSLSGIREIQGIFCVLGLFGNGQFSVSGHIHVFKEDYTFSSTNGDEVALRVTDPSAMKCSPPKMADLRSQGVFFEHASVHGDSIANIDVLAIYPSSLLENNDPIHIKSKVYAAKGVTDNAFANSGINAKINIVDVIECKSLEKGGVTELLREVGDGSNPGPAHKDISSLRDKYQADLVAILAPQKSGPVEGEAICIPEPPSHSQSDLLFATFAIYYSADFFGYTFAHELGHLLGGKHDRMTQPLHGGENHAFDYARGHVSGDYSFVTLLGYENLHDGKKYEYIPAYSASDKLWHGESMGVPLTAPAPADCAELFRWSTQVVANYRVNPELNSMNSVNLDLYVEPNQLGGFVTPSVAGPYRPGEQVTLTATPRIGHAFSHWLIDGAKFDVTAPQITLSMNYPLKVHAYFIKMEGAEPKITINSNGLNGILDIQLTGSKGGAIAEGAIEAGTDIKATATVPHAGNHAAPIFQLLNWTINGMNLHASVFQPLRLSVESDTVISVTPVPPRIIKTGEDNTYGINHVTKHTFRLVYDTVGFPLQNKKVNFALIDAPVGVKIDDDASSAFTDGSGLVEIRIFGGPPDMDNQEKILTVKCDIELDTKEKRTITYHGQLYGKYFSVHDNENYNRFLRKGDTPATITFQAFYNGSPMGNVKVELAVDILSGTKSISLKKGVIDTDSNGFGVIEFLEIDDEFGGWYAITGKTKTMTEAMLIAGIDVFPEKCDLRFVTYDTMTGDFSRPIALGDRPTLIIASAPQIMSFFSNPALLPDSLNLKIEDQDGKTIDIKRDLIYGFNHENYPCVELMSDIKGITTITAISKYGYESKPKKLPDAKETPS